MGLLSRSKSQRRVTLRVTADGAPAAFDALILFDQRRVFKGQTLRGQHTPFEIDLPDTDVTIVVQRRDHHRRVIAEYEVTASGKRQTWGRSWQPTSVLQRRGGRIVCAGLPEHTDPGNDVPPIGALAI